MATLKRGYPNSHALPSVCQMHSGSFWNLKHKPAIVASTDYPELATPVGSPQMATLREGGNPHILMLFLSLSFSIYRHIVLFWLKLSTQPFCFSLYISTDICLSLCYLHILLCDIFTAFLFILHSLSVCLLSTHDKVILTVNEQFQEIFTGHFYLSGVICITFIFLKPHF